VSVWWIRGPALVVVAVLFAVAALDLWFEITGRPPVGEYVIRWTQRYPIFAAFLAFLVGAMLSHFFWQV
jgi:hypothetical protein